MADEMPLGKLLLVGIRPHLPGKTGGLLRSWRRADSTDPLWGFLLKTFIGVKGMS